MPGLTKIPHALSPSQERKLVDFLDEKFLDVTRNFKKRSDPSSTLRTLSSYLTETHTILSLILQIPPVDPSTSLRTTLLLRITGEVMGSIGGYQPVVETLPQLLDWLNDMDRGWLAVLRSQEWDPEERLGHDLVISEDGNSAVPIRSTPISQTERTRLRSLLLSGTTKLEEWLERLVTDDDNYNDALERLGLQQSFDDLFAGTLTEMGALRGFEVNVPADMEGTC
ncbi:hypothetical protein QCA50_007598 [Cerrena zonata]|uniref:Uncharacterized protein n=1 Tax=Cerrena zonata TaxID=2478898 RepID=A0AAW0GBG6_9APHY